jgi:hypothetical protein
MSYIVILMSFTAIFPSIGYGLSYLINRMNLKQLEEVKTEAFYRVESHIGTEPICWVSTSYALKYKRCARDVKTLWFTRCKQTVDDV